MQGLGDFYKEQTNCPSFHAAEVIAVRMVWYVSSGQRREECSENGRMVTES